MSTFYDIAIIGAGTAGMTCAITAGEAGARVVLIEKADRPGGAMHWSGGHMSAGGSRHQKRNDISDSPDEHFDDIIRINNGSGDLKLIRKAVDEAPKTLDWLDDLGFPWAPECPRIIYGHVPYTKPRTQYGTNKAISIYETILPLWQKMIDSGHIRCITNAHFSSEVNEGPHNHVITYTSANGQESVRAKRVVYTSGGYGSNPNFFRSKHGDTPFNSSAYPDSTGEVIQYLEDNGAPFRMADLHLPSLGGIELEPGSGRSNFNEAWAMVLTSVYRQPRDIYVNSNGHRFMSEDEVNADTRERIVVQQDQWYFWVIFDEEALLERNENGDENPIIIGWTTEQIKKEARKGKAIFTADTIAELSQKTGIPVNPLQETIQRYNGFVENGADPDFGRTYLEHPVKKPPFYAIKVFASILVTFGGIIVNESLQILDKQGRPKEGLYAAGEILGLGALSGNAFCSGMAITPALSFGRVLGRTLTM